MPLRSTKQNSHLLSRITTIEEAIVNAEEDKIDALDHEPHRNSQLSFGEDMYALNQKFELMRLQEPVLHAYLM